MATATERPVGEAVLGGEVIGVPVGEVIGVGHGAIIGVTMVETANAIGIETVTMMATAAAVMQTDVVEAAMVTTGAIVTRICANELEHLATLAPASRGYRLGDLNRELLEPFTAVKPQRVFRQHASDGPGRFSIGKADCPQW